MELNIGEQAPDFTSKDEQGNDISLSDYKGKKVVLYFYPRDNTPGCTAQACNLKDNYSQLLKQGYVVLGVSTDSPKKHRNFIKKYELPFPLIADEDHSVHEKYDTWKEKKMYGKTYMGTARTTFVINENGIITDIIEKVDTKDHTSQIIS